MVKIQINHRASIAIKELASALYDEIGEEYNLSEEEVQDYFSIKSQLLIPDGTFITIFDMVLPELELRDQEPQDIIISYLNSLNQDDNILTIVKTSDSTLYNRASRYYQEIIELEMELRNALTYILTFDQKSIGSELFKEFGINQSEKKLNTDHIDKNYENGLFYIYFNHYASFTEPQQLKADRITQFLQEPSIQTFEDFKNRLSRRGISEERHLAFLSSISTKLKPLEDMRNAIMHIRNLSKTVVANFEKAANSFGDNKGVKELIQEFWINENEVLRGKTWLALAESQTKNVVTWARDQDGEPVFQTDDEHYDDELEEEYIGMDVLKSDLIPYLIDNVEVENFDPNIPEFEVKIIEMLDAILNELANIT